MSGNRRARPSTGETGRSREGLPQGAVAPRGGLAATLSRARLPARLAYVGVIVMATFMGLNPVWDMGGLLDRLERMWSPSLSARDVVDGARNVALFAGWGVVWMLTAPAGRTRPALAGAALSALLLSSLAEAAQLLSPVRNASVLDLATNVGGAVAGAVGLVVLVRGVGGRVGRKSFLGVPGALVAGAYGTAVLAEAMIPYLRQEPIPGVYGGPGGRMAAALELFAVDPWIGAPVGDFVLYLPLAVLATMTLVEFGAGYGQAALRAFLVTAAAVTVTEVLHGALALAISLGALAVHVFAVGTGALLAHRFLPRLSRSLRGPARVRAFLIAHAAVIGLWMFRPYWVSISLERVVGKLSTPWWIPMAFLGGRTDLFTVVDVVVAFSLFVPVGAVLAVWPLRRTGPLAHLLPGLYLSLGNELLQLGLRGRLLSIDDILIQAAGVFVGWAVVRRAGFTPYGESWPRDRARRSSGSGDRPGARQA